MNCNELRGPCWRGERRFLLLPLFGLFIVLLDSLLDWFAIFVQLWRIGVHSLGVVDEHLEDFTRLDVALHLLPELVSGVDILSFH